ncbi:MAG: hypothetical protein SFU86_02935 [Pirellulaceae bacterium]|nr:hypothetical protein [Pirellulaceae bacterium]
MAASRQYPRRAFSLTEVTLALFVVGMAAGALAQMLFVAAGQRRASEQRRLAGQEVANLAERIAARPYRELTGEWLASQTLSAEMRAAAPQAALLALLTSEEDPVPGRRVRIEVSWPNSVGQPVEPVGLTVWKYPPPETTP